jgi:RimJ/RimL family protein N-acetyltransferase
VSGGYATPRLVVRPWRHDEVDVMYDVYRRWEVARWLGATPKVAESVAAMHGTVDRWAALGAGADPFGVWAVVPAALGTPVGTVLLCPLPDEPEGTPSPDVEVGWHLHPDHWGHGYATEAGAGALAEAWRAGLPEVWAVVHEGNERSVAVTRRLDMRDEGVTDRWYGVPLLSFRALPPTDGTAGQHPDAPR